MLCTTTWAYVGDALSCIPRRVPRRAPNGGPQEAQQEDQEGIARVARVSAPHPLLGHQLGSRECSRSTLREGVGRAPHSVCVLPTPAL